MPEIDTSQLNSNLVACYDDLSRAISKCAFFMEAVGCLALYEALSDEEIISGTCVQGSELTQELLAVKARLKETIEQATTLN